MTEFFWMKVSNNCVPINGLIVRLRNNPLNFVPKSVIPSKWA